MTLYIDPPTWPAHGRSWSHLVSDTSFEELHAFAADLGLPARAFDGDHYDVPDHRYADAVRSGAVAVGGKELLRRLVAAGLRRPKHRRAAGPQPGRPGAAGHRPPQDRPGPEAEPPQGG
ncbi:DUF4031 domain-containing protein [Streptomyces sp. NPDC059740]|uniref:DUF4031 domain-containing protein n=1 Tax=Streptomyces sp. NPDC059740 TaxID=3346926 RepID=UPI0036572A21